MKSNFSWFPDNPGNEILRHILEYFIAAKYQDREVLLTKPEFSNVFYATGK